MSKLLRLQKFIADCGYTSRRKAENLILQGHVEVNGSRVTELGTKVNPSADTVSVKGEFLDLGIIQKIYVVLNKPRGCVTTVDDPQGRTTVMDLVREFSERIYPVGRLDYLSEGLLLLTNDGDLAQNIIHPSSDLTKVYEVKVFGLVTPEILKKLKNGVKTEVGFLKPKSVRIIKILKAKTWLEFRLSEGKNREIRRICDEVGLTVDKLKRLAIGGLTIQGLSAGKYHIYTKRKLLNALGLSYEGIVNKDLEFISDKKSIKFKEKKGKKHQEKKKADDSTFHQYRKENYYETIKNIKDIKDQELEKNELKADVLNIKEDKAKQRDIVKKEMNLGINEEIKKDES